MYMHTWTYPAMCPSLSPCVCIYRYVYVCIYIYINRSWIDMYIYTYVCMYACMHACTYMYVYGGCPMFLLPEVGQPPHFCRSFRELLHAILNLSSKNNLSVVRSAGQFQTKTQTHSDSQGELVSSRLRWLSRAPFARLSRIFHASFARLSRKSTLQQCSHGASVIPPKWYSRS